MTIKDKTIDDGRTELLTPEDLDIHERNIDYWDRGNPWSMINVAPNAIKKVMDGTIDIGMDWDLLGMDEHELRKIVRPSAQMGKLRISFWYEYDRKTTRGKPTKMALQNVSKGICSREKLEKLLTDKYNLAWILCPVQSYNSAAQEALETTLHKLRSALDVDLTYYDSKTKKKKLDTAAFRSILEFHKILSNRLQGSPVQRILEQKNISVESESSRVLNSVEIEAELKSLGYEKIDGRKNNGKPDIEV